MLPEAAVLAWDLLAGAIPANAPPQGRLFGLPDGDLDALVGLYTRAAPDLHLVRALAPIESRIRRPEYVVWKLAAGAPDAREELFLWLSQCAAADEPTCPTLPPELTFKPEETRQWWLAMVPSVRALVLARTQGEETAAMTLGLLLDADYSEVEIYWRAMLNHSEARTSVALVLLSQLLDSASALPAQFQLIPKPSAPYRSGRLHHGAASEAAQHLLADHARTQLPLWQGLSMHANPWVASLGIVGLISAGQRDSAERAVAAAQAPRASLDRLVLDLVQRQNGAAFDSYLLDRAQLARDAEEACWIVGGMSGERTARLRPALMPWAAQQLSRLPPEKVLAIETLPARPDNRVLDEASGHALCVLEVVPPPERVDPRDPDYRAIAQTLVSSSAELLQVLGAIMYARAGEPEFARRMHAQLISRPPFPAQAAILAALENPLR